MKKVIGLIGEQAGGKGTVADYLIREHGAVSYGTSAILKKTIDNLHLQSTRENYTKLALLFKDSFTPSVIIDALISDIEENNEELVIADGIRMNGDVEPFQKKYGDNFYLVYVTADIEKRFERSKKRKEKTGEDKATFEQFAKEEVSLETEKAITEIGKQADFRLENNGTREELEEQIKVMIGEIGISS